MWSKFKEDAIAFVGGCIGWGAICWRILFGGVFNLSIDVAVKGVMWALGMIGGGFLTAWGKHLFDKYKNRKNKDNGKRKDSEAA